MDCGEFPVFEVKPFESAVEAVFAAECFDVTAVVAADHWKFVAAEMRAVFVDE